MEPLSHSRACAYWSETLTYSSSGSSREGLDLGGSFGRFQMARRFGRKLQTPFIGFGKEQSHESLGRSERPSDRGRPRMRNRPPSLAIQILAESTKEGAEDFSKPMAAWTPLFFYQTLAPARVVRKLCILQRSES
jgi:hypothetical protein